MGRLTSHWVAVLILFSHLSLGVIYSLVVPVWEAPDEWGHYPYVRYVAANRALPPPDLELSSRDDESKRQPSLYYIMAAPAVLFVDTSDQLQPEINPWAFSGRGEAGRNVALHTESEAFPYEGTVLAIHLTRLVSVLLGTMAVGLTYLMARLVFPGRRAVALGALAVHAFMPQLLFMGAVVSNDIAVTAFSSLALYFMLRVLIAGGSWRNVIGVTLAVVLAVLSKLNGVALIPLVVITLVTLWLLRRRTDTIKAEMGRSFSVFMGAGLVFLVWLIAGGLSLGRMVESPQSSLRQFIAELTSDPIGLIGGLHWEGLSEFISKPFVTFWLAFGWGDVRAEDGVYILLAMLSVMALMGSVLFGIRKRHPMLNRVAFLLIIAHLGLSLIMMLSLSLYADWAVGGRYLLPVSSAVSIILVVGLSEWLPRRRQTLVPVALGVAMLAFGVLAPFRYIAPAYAQPLLLSVDSEGDVANPTQIVFGDDIVLVGYDVDAGADEAEITLYWKPRHEIAESYALALKLVDAEGHVWAELHSYPGRGNYITTEWKPGSIIVDTYRVEYLSLPENPQAANLYVALFTYPEMEYLTAYDGQGTPMGEAAIFGILRLPGREAVALPASGNLRYELGDEPILLDYEIEQTQVRPGDVLNVGLYWQSESAINSDYHVFLHLSNDAEQILVQTDSSPRGGDYPTALWQSGEVVRDEYQLHILPSTPDGVYHLWAGMYDIADGIRLTVRSDTGEEQPDNRAHLGTIRVGD